MGLGTVIPTVLFIGAVVNGQSVHLCMSQYLVTACCTHIVYAAASSVCFAFKSGRTIYDIQMIVLHTRCWYVDMNTLPPSGVG